MHRSTLSAFHVALTISTLVGVTLWGIILLNAFESNNALYIGLWCAATIAYVTGTITLSSRAKTLIGRWATLVVGFLLPYAISWILLMADPSGGLILGLLISHILAVMLAVTVLTILAIPALRRAWLSHSS